MLFGEKMELGVVHNRSHVVYLQEHGRILVRELMPGCAQLFISDVTLDDAGVYVCESSNYIGVDRRNATIEIGCNYHLRFARKKSVPRAVDKCAAPRRRCAKTGCTS